MRRSLHHPTWKEIGQACAYVAFAFLLIFLGAALQECRAQNVVRKGHSFYQQQSTNKIDKDSVVFSGYHYFDTKGVRYPIYISSKGKCFIIRTSSKTGKKYKQYLPEVSKEIKLCGK